MEPFSIILICSSISLFLFIIILLICTVYRCVSTKKPRPQQSFRPRLSSPIYAISSNSQSIEKTGNKKKSQSFYGTPSPLPDQKEYLDIGSGMSGQQRKAAQWRAASERTRTHHHSDMDSRERPISRSRISIVHETPFSHSNSLHPYSTQFSSGRETFVDPPITRRSDVY